MNILGYISLFVILFLCGGCSSSKNIRLEHNYDKNKKETFYFYLDPSGNKIKHGPYYSFKHRPEGNYESWIYYKNGKEDGLSIHKGKDSTDVAIYFQGRLVQFASFNKRGEQVAFCSIKNNQPFNGTIWKYAFGLRGVKWNKIETYENGKLIKQEDCDLNGAMRQQGNTDSSIRVPVKAK